MDTAKDTKINIFSAVRDGNLEELKDLANTAGLCFASALEDGLLCEAIKHKQSDVAKWLISNGARVSNNSTDRIATPLHFAVLLEDLDLIVLLLSKGCNVNAKDENLKTALHYGCQGNHRIVKLLLKHGAEVNSRDISGETPLQIATKNDCAIKDLVKNGACIDEFGLIDFPLYIAAKEGNLEAVVLFLHHGANVNGRNKDNSTALHIATLEENFDVVRVLLKNGAHVNLQNAKGSIALHYAVNCKSLTIAKEILKYRPKVNLKNKNGETPLHVLMKNKNFMYKKSSEIVKFSKSLLESGAKVDGADKNGKTILDLAVEHRNLKIVEEILSHSPEVQRNKLSLKNAVLNSGCNAIINALLDYGFVIEPSDAKDTDLLHSAVHYGYLRMVKELLACGANANFANTNWTRLHFISEEYYNELTFLSTISNYNNKSPGKPPLFYSLQPEKIEICKLLLEKGASVEDPGLLINAIREESLEVVDALLAHGADPNGQDKYGQTPLHYTSGDKMELDDEFKRKYSYNGQIKGKIAELLLTKNAKVNAVMKDGRTPLHLACRKGREEVVAVLLKYNANVNVRNRERQTPLFCAAKNGNEKVTTMLLNAGADYDVICIDRFEESKPLFVACKAGHANVVKLLLMCGAEVNEKRKIFSALHEAANGGHTKTVEVLLQHGAKVGIKDRCGGTPLHVAASNYKDKVVEILGKAGAKVNIRDRFGQTPLCSTMHHGDLATIANLIKYGANINDQNKRGKTPLYAAIRIGGYGTIQFLLDHGADINITGKNGKPLLAWAAKRLNEFFGESSNDNLEDNAGYHYNFLAQLKRDEKCSVKNVAETLIRHLIIRKFVGFYVSHDNLQAIGANEMMRNYYCKCVMEMKKIKDSKIPNTNISIFDVLTKDLREVAKYIKNEHVKRLFYASASREHFPLYAEDIARQIRRGKTRNELIENVRYVLRNSKLFKLPNVCIEKIFDYLDNKDILEFETPGIVGRPPTLLKPYFRLSSTEY